jgi:hypothetical protein
MLQYKIFKQTPWPESASELYRPSDRRLSAKFMPTFCETSRFPNFVDDSRPTDGGEVVRSCAPASFSPRKITGTRFFKVAESNPGP